MPFEFMADLSLTWPLDSGGCGLTKIIPAGRIHDFGVQVFQDKNKRSLPQGQGVVPVKSIEKSIFRGEFDFLNVSESQMEKIRQNATSCFDLDDDGKKKKKPKKEKKG
jgi:hypothetical protein